MSKTPFPLGVYVGNPNGSDASAEAQFEANYSGFVSAMGAAPSYLDLYVDYTKPVDQWVDNAGWQAWSAANSPDAKLMTPVIGLPMYSTGDTSISIDQYYKNFAAGDYDSVIQGVVKQYADNGFMTQVWRPGWEMNLNGPTTATTDPATQADYVAAFQHVYTELHSAAAADGVSLQVVWNPGVTNYGVATDATTTLYPGSNYVDIIGADVYSDAYPYGNANQIYDWDKSGQVYNSAHPVYDTSIAQWASDPVNLAHYYTDPASQQWAADGSDGHATSLQDLIDLAKADGKPIAIAETGAGGTGDGANVPDNPTFVNWLATTLQDSGVPVSFVNIWDSNAAVNDEYSAASDDKPLEATAWANDFGNPAYATNPVTGVAGASVGGGSSAGGTPTPAPPVPSVPSYPATVSVGSGPDTLDLHVSEDAYQGDAQFTVSVDGRQVGGTQTAQASHAGSADQDFQFLGTWGAGTHTVAVDFLNDLYGGTASTDRNLYVDAATYHGASAAAAPLALLGGGTESFRVGQAPPALLAQTGDQRMAGGQAFSFTLPSATFGSGDGSTLAYSAEQPGGAALPSWLKFNAATLTFSGTAPTSGAALPIVLVAAKSDGTAAAEEFHLYASSGRPVLQAQAPDQRLPGDKAFSFGLPAHSYADPAGGTVSYSAMQTDGSALPAWATFNSSTGTFSGTTPIAVSDLHVEVVATSSEGSAAAEAFHIYTQPTSPVLGKQAPDQFLKDGAAFSFAMPSGSYSSPDSSALSYSARQTDLSALPSWMSFNSQTDTFSGTAPSASSAVLGVRIDASTGNGGAAAEAFHVYLHA